LGPYSPVALSDYGSGTNHVLPTGGFANRSQAYPLGLYAASKHSGKHKSGIRTSARTASKLLTEAENLPNHYKAIQARLEK
jgi:histidinol dehydrogenase